MRKYLSQEVRFGLTVFYLLSLLWVANRIFDYNSLFPPFGANGFWFWTVFASLIGTTLLEQHRYTPPGSAFLNALAVTVPAIEILNDKSLQIPNDASLLWRVYLITAIGVMVTAGLAITLRRLRWMTTKNIAKLFTRLSNLFGSPQAVFGALFLLLLYSFHRSNLTEMFWLFTLWIIFAWQPLERLVPYVLDFIASLKITEDSFKIGNVISYRQPGIVNLLVTADSIPEPRSLVAVISDQGHFQLALIIDNYQLAATQWSRGIILNWKVPLTKPNITGQWGEIGSVLNCDPNTLSEACRAKLKQHPCYRHRDRLLGLIVENSNVNTVHVELVRDDIPIEEGQLLDAAIGDTNVLYQIINGVTDSETLEQSNRHGYMVIQARKLGTWNDTNNSLEQVPWLPEIFTPVYLRNRATSEFNTAFIGYIPQTSYGLAVDCHTLVTHNTAILGVLGTGKTFLALDLISHMLLEGISVWVIDITGRYREDLAPLLDSASHEKADADIKTAIKPKELFPYENKEYGGNHPTFREKLRHQIQEFLDNTTPQIRVFEPTEFRVTEQTTRIRSAEIDGEWTQQVGHGLLTHAQITRIVTEELLACVQEKGVSETARVCLVLEEAHSLVPEWQVAVSEGDSRASNATAKAILQGRKYGLGCLLITQRTAHVTKSVLNQCNTLFALQTFDKTGMDFLSNYIGDDYTNTLSTLQKRHCVAYGKGLNTAVPLIIKLNEYPSSEAIVTEFINPIPTD